MKKFIHILTLLILIVTATTTARAETWSTDELTGTIDKNDIVMSLTINEDNGKVTGWYYYKSAGKGNKIDLSGSCELVRDYPIAYEMILKETAKGNVTGTFNIIYEQSFVQGIAIQNISGNLETSDGSKYEVSTGRSEEF